MEDTIGPLNGAESGAHMQMMTAFAGAFAHALEAFGKLQPETPAPVKETPIK